MPHFINELKNKANPDPSKPWTGKKIKPPNVVTYKKADVEINLSDRMYFYVKKNEKMCKLTMDYGP